MCDKCEIYERYLKRIAACKYNPDPFGYLPALANEALDEAAQHRVQLTGLCACKIFIPSAHSTALVCRNCGKPPRN